MMAIISVLQAAGAPVAASTRQGARARDVLDVLLRAETAPLLRPRRPTAAGLGRRGMHVGVTDPGARANAAMDRYASGDDAAFRELYDALSPRLYGFVLRLCCDPSRAEDLVQQTFLQMHDARFRFISGSDVAPWAMAIARRLFIDTVRQSRRHATSPVDGQSLDETNPSLDPSAEELLSAHETAAVLDARIEKLPEAHRDAFLLLRVEGLSLAQAASVLGVTVAAVKVRAHRAYTRLRQAAGRAEKSR